MVITGAFLTDKLTRNFGVNIGPSKQRNFNKESNMIFDILRQHYHMPSSRGIGNQSLICTGTTNNTASVLQLPLR